MPKSKSIYVCNSCAFESSKWMGKCTVCNAWNSFEEQEKIKSSHSSKRRSEVDFVALHQVDGMEEQRIKFLDNELNNVLGGGLVPGSMLLLGGEPGVGKSTLLLQNALQSHWPSIYITGEESPQQVKQRAARLYSKKNETIDLLNTTDLEDILKILKVNKHPLVIVDSIQTLYSNQIDSAPGSLNQIRFCAQELMKISKSTNQCIFLIGHITKDGQLAGPKILEHLVDVVLYFEGNRNHDYRLVRAVKNRFGSAMALGIYEMTAQGLMAVKDTAQLTLSPSKTNHPGLARSVSMEGIRPLMVEVQALVGNAVYGTSQRNANGFDMRRLNMLIAVLEKKCEIQLGNKDVFLNITGGLKLEDPLVDLAVMAALLSSFFETPLPKGSVFIGEVGLTGEIRGTNKMNLRREEAIKNGAGKIFLPQQKSVNNQNQQLEFENIPDLMQYLFG
ncbi:MAG: DNA repair protein RadA [Bacteroidota bacterium]|nr:DNA repair protein RadA [Bacteroidota bacterium]